MVITPEETQRAGLENVHIVLPVELYLVDSTDIFGMSDDETTRGTMLQLLVTTEEVKR